MPTLHNGGRFLWGSAWRLEPRRGDSKRQASLGLGGGFLPSIRVTAHMRLAGLSVSAHPLWDGEEHSPWLRRGRG